MPFVTVRRKAEPKETAETELSYPEIRFVFVHPDRAGVKTLVVEESPRNRTIRCRHHFQDGPYTEFYLAKPWSYMLVRVDKSMTVLLSGLFFSEKPFGGPKEEGILAAPLPNVDYGIDHGMGVCLWAQGKRFGKSYKEVAVQVHKYFWTSDFNTGVRYYDSGRPGEIRASSWLGSLKKWQELTREGKRISWVPIKDERGLEVRTLEDAWGWLSRNRDFNYR